MTENCAATSVPFYTVPEAATLLEWSEDRVWMALETGQLPAIAPAYWGSPELFEYRFAPPEVVLAIRAAGSDEVTWPDRGPVGPARFPANPSKIRLLAEYVDALLILSPGIEPAASGVRRAEVRVAPGVSKQPAGTAAESEPEGAHQAEAGVSTDGLVAWQAVVIEYWPKIAKACGGKPTARKAMQWLKKHGPRDTIPEHQPDRDVMRWIDRDNNPKSVALKTIQNQFPALQKAAETPA